MKMTPTDFLFAFVKENYNDFCSDPGNVRKGINAAVSAFHMADHFYKYSEKNEPQNISKFKSRKHFLQYLGTICPLFNDVQSIANVYKHLYLDGNKSHVQLESTGAIYSISDDETEIEMSFDREVDGGGTVIYKNKHGEEKELHYAVEAVIEMWNKMIFKT